MTILKLLLNIKSIAKSQEMKKLLEKQIHMRNLHKREQQTVMKFRETFTIMKMITKKINGLLQKLILQIKITKIIAYVIMVAILKTVLTKAL